jgi:hypothetical protein
MDENGYNFKTTTTFDDGDVVTEYFKTQRGCNWAKRWWYVAQKIEGGTYSVTGFEVEAL